VSSRELHARIPGAELVEIGDAGHLHFIEQAEKFNAVCLEFLRKHRGA
jgi:pimeloyl-ACP methyl ester carboxylesterase